MDTDPHRQALDADPDPDPQKMMPIGPVPIQIHNTAGNLG
jgi:hypothetical protein